MKITTIDFETKKIEQRPRYPPEPVGVAIHEPGRKPEYLAWGHPTENNATKEQARARLLGIWRSNTPILCHHAKFDLDVAETHLDLPHPPWHLFHDTMFLLFLDDPHAANLSLKPSAERLLGLAPEERDAVRDWLVEHHPEVRRNKRAWGAYISEAPGRLVGRYAVGDVVRTRQLFDLLHRRVLDAGMGTAYDRERRLQPHLLASERRGVPVGTVRLARDIQTFTKVREEVDKRICKLLRTKDLNIDSNDELVAALQRSKHVDNGAWLRTATGKVSTSKDSVEAAVTSVELRRLLRYRAALGTTIGTFMTPWLLEGRANGGTVHPDWNQVRQPGERERGFQGTRTGRLSVSRFMNTPKEFVDEKTDEPIVPPKGLPPLPLARSYLEPGNGQVWLKRDYSQQELRLLGHFENEVLMQAYHDDPWLDVHAKARTLINEMLNTNYGRKPIKNTGFGIIYGMGIGKLALKSQIDAASAKQVRNAYLEIFPGLKDLTRGLKQLAKDDEPLTTWGGRTYYCEPPKMVDGRRMTFEYKMLNYLIQGSAADCTKEAIIRYHETPFLAGEFLLTVHDEVNIRAEKAAVPLAMRQLREAMESIEVDVPLLSDGEYSTQNWGLLRDYADQDRNTYHKP